MGFVINYYDFSESIKLEVVEELRECSSAKIPIVYNLKLEATYNNVLDVENSSRNRTFKTSVKELFPIGNIEWSKISRNLSLRRTSTRE